MADFVQAGTQTGSGPKFTSNRDGSSVDTPVMQPGFGPLGSTPTLVDDAAAQRLPVKPVGPQGSFTARSGTIAVGGTSQQLAAANAARVFLEVWNPPTESETLYINFGSGAAGDNSSIPLMPGAVWRMSTPGFVSTEAVNVIAATTGHTYGAKEA